MIGRRNKKKKLGEKGRWKATREAQSMQSEENRNTKRIKTKIIKIKTLKQSF